LSPALGAYATGNLFSFVAANTNTGAATINLNSLGAKSITKLGSTALAAGDIVSGRIYLIEYDGTRFQLLNPSASSVASFSAGSTGFTPSTATTGAVTLAGTLATTNGGTGLTSFTANGVVYASSSSALTTGSALQFDGTNLGVGVTLASWSLANYKALQVGNSSIFSSVTSGDSNFTSNAYYNSGWKYIVNAAASYYSQNGGTHYWYNAPSGTAGNAITFTQAMTLDASGNLLVGTTTARTTLTVAGSISLGATPAGGVAGTAYSVVGNSANSGSANGGDLTVVAGGGSGAGTNGNLTLRAGQTVSTGSVTTGGNLILESGKPSDGLASGYIAFNGYSGNPSIATERARIDSSGNLGLGVTPSAWATFTAQQIGPAGGMSLYASADNVNIAANVYYNAGYKRVGAYAASSYQQGSGAHYWNTAASSTAGSAITFTQAMTLDASGNLLVGTTSTNPVGTRVNGNFINAGGGSNIRGASGNTALGLNVTSGTHITFYTDNGSAAVSAGTITSSGAATLYNATSDYRLKTVVGSIVDSGTRIDALEPIEYEWKEDGKRTRGFLAHKFQEIYANSVSGLKDAVDIDGKPIYQAMQASSSEVIADLVAEIQSLRKRLTALEST